MWTHAHVHKRGAERSYAASLFEFLSEQSRSRLSSSRHVNVWKDSVNQQSNRTKKANKSKFPRYFEVRKPRHLDVLKMAHDVRYL